MAQEKGIRVLFEAKDVGLTTALRNAEKQSRSLQSELKSVNSALKLDPTNVDLLRQRQDLFSKSIEQTKEKLKALNDAKIKADEEMKNGTSINEAQYRKLQREITFTENNLKQLEEQQYQNTEAYKAEQKAIEEKAAAEQKAIETTKKADETSKKITDTMKKASQAIGAVTIAVGTAAVKASLDFDDAMAKVSTIAEESEVPLDTMKNQILELSKETGIAAADIANNVYDAISAGQKTGDAVNFVTNSTKLAKAGFADSGQALDLLTTILNAYGMEAEKVGEVSDMLIQTQDKGKVTVGELSSSMGKVIPTAKAFNVSLDQVATGYTIMTSKGIKAAETTTYMNSMLNELGKSGTDASEIIKDKTGKSFQDLMAEGKSLGDVLKILDDNAKKNNQSLADMFGSAEAGKAALTLLSDGSEAFNSSLAEMNNSTGATQKAFDKLQTPAERFRKQLNELKIKAIELGDKLQPVFKIVQDLFGFIIKNSDKVIKLVGAVGMGFLAWNIVTMVQRVVQAIRGMITAIQTAKTVQAAFNATMASSGFGLIAAAIGTVVTALVLFADKSEIAEDSFSSLADNVNKNKKAWEELKKAQDESIKSINNEFSRIEDLKNHLNDLVDSNGNVVKSKEEVKTITDEINSIMPDTISYVEEEGKAYIENYKAIDDLILKKKTLKIYEEKEKTLDETKEKLQEAKISQAKLYNQIITEQQRIYEEYMARSQDKSLAAMDRAKKLAVDSTTWMTEQYNQNENLINSYTNDIEMIEKGHIAIIQNDTEGMKAFVENSSYNLKKYGEATTAELKKQHEEAKQDLEDKKAAYAIYGDEATAKAVEQAEKMVQKTQEQLDLAIEEGPSIGAKWMEKISDGMSSKSDFVANVMIDAVRSAKESLSVFMQGKDFQDDCVEIARYMIEGLNDGFVAASPMLRTTLQNSMNNARSSLRHTEDIRSPSRRWEKEIGQHLLPGVAKGVEKTQPVLNRALSRAMDKARKAMYSDESTSLGIPTKVLTSIHGATSQSLQPVSGPVININGTKVFNMDDVNKLGAALVKYIKRSGG